MIQSVATAIILFSLGVVVGRFIKLPVGRWALLIVVLAVLVGGAYLYGAFNTLQSVKTPGIMSLLSSLW